MSGELIKIHDSHTKAARDLGLSQGNIGMCVKGIRHHHGGFIWEDYESSKKKQHE